jgi:alpha-tubulin suppressor-like RCC1 family protein
MRAAALAALATLGGLSCGSDTPGLVQQQQQVGFILIQVPPQSVERGTRVKFTATVSDVHNQVIDVPVVWHSDNLLAGTFDANGVLTALNVGTIQVTASSLGYTSPATTITVVWNGAASMAPSNWTQPNAATPGAVVSDSIRVFVTNTASAPVAGTRIAFAVTGGGGTVSPAVVTSSGNGVAATQWTLGSSAGANSITATVVDTSNQALTFVQNNPLSFSVKSYAALSAVTGDHQTAQILSDLPIAPSVKLVDSLGHTRPGVPITFSATGGGRVASPTVSTGADGVASPGTWTLGDATGAQSLVARVESATLKLQATGTGTAIRYTPAQIALGDLATCGLDAGGVASCMGQEPQIGGGDTINKSTPTPVAASLSLQRVAGGPSHFCGIASDNSIYCWGVNALVDTSGKNAGLATKPTQLPSTLTWSQVSPGASHTCALTATQDAYCWGADQSGQLGIRGDTTPVFVPTAVSGGFKFASIAAGSNHACALTVSHDALCWGSNQFGQLGDLTQTNRVAPTIVSGGLSFQAIAAGDPWTCGLTTTGVAYCWGGLQGIGSVSSPHAYTGTPTFVSLAVGSVHACALAADGSAYCWGNNQFGQLGDSTTVSRTDPTPVAGGLKFKSIAAGVAHTCGIVIDGSMACWGLNLTGELGQKISTTQMVPRSVVLGVNP